MEVGEVGGREEVGSHFLLYLFAWGCVCVSVCVFVGLAPPHHRGICTNVSTLVNNAR